LDEIQQVFHDDLAIRSSTKLSTTERAMLSRRKYMVAESSDRTGSPADAAQQAKEHAQAKSPLWHKDTPGFWLAVCVGLSVIFALAYTALR